MLDAAVGDRAQPFDRSGDLERLQPREEVPLFSQAELDQILAPVALYPDQLLSQVLMAATYPLEVVQAARWSREHPGLQGQEAVRAVDDKAWDPSVKSLVAFPNLLARMDENLEWTRRLGDAFLAQNAKQAGVTTTKSGLQYKVLQPGTGRSPPQPGGVELNLAVFGSGQAWPTCSARCTSLCHGRA